ncbi:MAG: hypothetical protein PHO70_03450 [Candidatus Omnitrophica bacterium]|nr:hypothetical protein [Candidatus Omnitrophota bacterium]
MKKYNKVFLLFLLVLFYSFGLAFSGIPEEFKDKINNLKWVAYTPTNFDPNRNSFPSEESIIADLNVLYKYGFRGIVTYGSDGILAQIPRLAKEAGFEGVIMGIWDIDEREEIMSAVLARDYVDGYCVGNEGLNFRYDLETLNNSIAEIKELTEKPVTTTEHLTDYSNDQVYNLGDWVFPNCHPFLSNVKEPKKAVAWIEKYFNRLNKHCQSDRVVIFKEVGFPTQGDHKASEAKQNEFFKAMEDMNVTFVYFEAFDQFWKNDTSVEPHWGLFTSKRRPKKFIASQ